LPGHPIYKENGASEFVGMDDRVLPLTEIDSQLPIVVYSESRKRLIPFSDSVPQKIRRICAAMAVARLVHAGLRMM
jgi:hypothetical protein